MMPDERLPHLDAAGRARMIDVGGKEPTRRTAVAEGTIRMRPGTLGAIRAGAVAKGDVEAVARIAAIGGAKRAADLVPLCHPLPLDGVRVEIETFGEDPGLGPEEGPWGGPEEGPERAPAGLRLEAEVTTVARTGVEMEALCAVAAGLLAVYDMCKSRDRGMEIGPIRLLAKRGGRSGTWERDGRLPSVAPGAEPFDSGDGHDAPMEGME